LYTYNKRKGGRLVSKSKKFFNPLTKKRGVRKMMTPEEEKVLREKARHDDHVRAINKRSFVRRQTWIKLMLAKADAKGIKVSPAEVEAEMKK
jgi:hypothetical protein